MKYESDGLEIYVLGLAKSLLILAILLLPLFILMRLPASFEPPNIISFEPPNIIKYCFAIHYFFVLIIGSLLSITLYPFGFFIPACLYLARYYFQRSAKSKQHVAFVVFVLFFFAGFIFLMINTILAPALNETLLID